MLGAIWLYTVLLSLYGFANSLQLENRKDEDSAVDEQQMDNLAEWMSSALQKDDENEFLNKLRMDDTYKRDENKEELPGFIGVRGKREKTNEMNEDSSFGDKVQQEENFPPGFVAARGKKLQDPSGKKETLPGFIGVRGRRQQTQDAIPGFVASRGKKQVIIPGYVAPRGRRDHAATGFYSLSDRRKDIPLGFIGVRGKRYGLIAPLFDRRNVDNRGIPLAVVRGNNMYGISDISDDDYETQLEKEFEIAIPEMEPKQVSTESIINKNYIDCIRGNDYFCRRFVAIKG